MTKGDAERRDRIRAARVMITHKTRSQANAQSMIMRALQGESGANLKDAEPRPASEKEGRKRRRALAIIEQSSRCDAVAPQAVASNPAAARRC